MSRLINKLENKLTKEGLKESSIKTHISNLEKIINNTGIKKVNEKNKNKIVETIENEPISDNTKKSRYKTLLVLLRNEEKNKKLWEFFNVKIKETNVKVDKVLKENKFSSKELDNKVKWKDIKKIKPKNLNEEIFLSLIVNDNLFLRLEVFNIKLDEFNETTDNYIDGPFLHMNSFKNISKLGPQKFSLSDKTTDIIEKIKGSWLMSNHVINPSGKSKWIKRFFNKNVGKEINNNLLRKIYVNKFDFNKLSGAKLDKIAKKMLNTSNTIRENYMKVNG